MKNIIDFENRIKKLEIEDIAKDEREFNIECRIDILEEKIIELEKQLELINNKKNV